MSDTMTPDQQKVHRAHLAFMHAACAAAEAQIEHQQAITDYGRNVINASQMMNLAQARRSADAAASKAALAFIEVMTETKVIARPPEA